MAFSFTEREAWKRGSHRRVECVPALIAQPRKGGPQVRRPVRPGTAGSYFARSWTHLLALCAQRALR